MPHTNDPDARPAVDALLARTRLAVLNVLVGDAAIIALSGWLLRRRAEDAIISPSRALHDALMIALVAVAVASYLMRRTWARRPSFVESERRDARFFRSHAGAAVVAGLAIPLGFAYGWWVDPRLEGVIPFWVVPLALGLLAFPRRGELEESGAGPPDARASTT